MKYDIMDVTLRDGSYEVNFQFTEEDTTQTVKAVAAAGIPYVEVGHGLGLNASGVKHGIAVCSDREYLEAAQRANSDINYGMFCIPGIARVEDLNLLREYGASFVRIGCNTTIDEVRKSAPYIKKARDLGLQVFANYMKTYVADDKNFSECIKMSVDYGAESLVIVDSAGCMLPDDISHYYDIIREEFQDNVKIGFHGHDNLGLSVSNSIHALKIGCDIVDTSLQSLGRGAGNASTEQVIAVLQKGFEETNYKLAPLMAFSEDYLRSKVNFKGVSGLDTYCGIAGFHSGYMNSVRKMVKKYGVNPYELILAYCERDRIGMDEDILEAISQTIVH